ncbi:MAG: hypothetical protein ABI877_09990, partial [Gemmatimonadaceae bacterium]
MHAGATPETSGFLYSQPMQPGEPSDDVPPDGAPPDDDAPIPSDGDQSPGMRSVSGRRIDSEARAVAEKQSVEALKERTEAGHLAAGRTPPSSQSDARTSGAHRAIDTAIRDILPVTEDAKLLQQPFRRDNFTQTDPWRVMRIMSEFI